MEEEADWRLFPERFLGRVNPRGEGSLLLIKPSREPRDGNP